GAIAVLCMSFPMTFSPGVIADLRNVVVMMAAPFGGPVAGLVAGALAAAYRLHLGGAGASIGAVTIALSALLGCAYALRYGELRSLRGAFALGMALTAITLPPFLLMPAPSSGPSFVAGVGPILAVLNPLASVALWFIMSIEIKRRAAEAARRRSEQRFRDIVETASDWFWEMDANLRFTYVSARFEKITGTPPGFLLGKRRDEVWYGPLTNSLKQHLEDLAQRRGFHDFRYPIRKADGSLGHLSASGKPLFDDAGAFCGYCGSGSDVSAEVEAVNALKRARHKAEESNRIKSTFLANMSHELRTPLNAVIGFSEIMRDELLGPLGTPSYKEYAGDINDSGRFLLSMINDILDLSKVEAGHYELYPERQAVHTLVASSAKLLAQRASSKGVQLRVEIPHDLPLINVDERLMRQTLINLIGNAVKFTDAGGEVAVTARRHGNGDLELAIADSGIGIATEDFDAIMEPFRQARHGRQTRDGTGLGLPLSKAFITLHGGRLSLESRLGVGTTVRVRLPAKLVLDQDAAPLAALPREAARAEG
ncbi:MAG: ATP-binding protein, partial [Rhodovibrionaceae bacterium]